jgi:hypothetical protein
MSVALNELLLLDLISLAMGTEPNLMKPLTGKSTHPTENALNVQTSKNPACQRQGQLRLKLELEYRRGKIKARGLLSPKIHQMGDA